MIAGMLTACAFLTATPISCNTQTSRYALPDPGLLWAAPIRRRFFQSATAKPWEGIENASSPAASR